MNEHPYHFYNNIPFGFKMFIAITRCLPVRLGDNLMLNIWGKAIGWDWNGMKRF
jgi:hypothetical protein